MSEPSIEILVDGAVNDSVAVHQVPLGDPNDLLVEIDGEKPAGASRNGRFGEGNMKRTGRGGGNEKPGRPPTPECGTCGSKLIPASTTEWKCPNAACSEHNQPVSTGVYPT